MGNLVMTKSQMTADEEKMQRLVWKMNEDQFIDFMAQMIIKYADQMQPVFAEREAEFNARGTSSKEIWEEIEKDNKLGLLDHEQLVDEVVRRKKKREVAAMER